MEKLLLILLLFAGSHSSAQGGDELKRLMEAYRTKGTISFDIDYRCYQVNKPSQVLDSLSGACIMGPEGCWYRIDATEMVQDTAYAIALFPEDRIMYVSKRKNAVPFATSIPLLDSALSTHLEQVDLIKGKREKELVFAFRDTSSYKRMHLFIDNKSGLLNRALIKVSARMLYDPEVRELVETNGSDAMVEVNYSHYRQEAGEAVQLRSSHYLKQGEEGLVPTSAFQQYKIFIGSLAP